MNVLVGYTNHPEVPLTSPFPPRRSVMVRVLGGDYLDPMGLDKNWFREPHPRTVLRSYVPLWASWVLLLVTTALAAWASWAAPWWGGVLAWVAWLFVPGKFISWRWDDRGGYIGSKVYGVDSEVYGIWLCPAAKVYPGSRAFCQSARLWANLKGRA